jgi:hypothetical protein
MRRVFPAIGAILISTTAWAGGELAVVSITPARHAVSAPANSDIVITFDRAVAPASAEAHIHVYAVNRAAPPGSFSFESGNTVVRFDPTADFAAGEVVTVVIGNQLAAQDASTMRSAGYAHQFWIATRPCGLEYVQGQVNDVADRASPRPYGGAASDLDHDGFIDLAIINEDTSDLRILLNNADGMGTFAPFMLPTTATGAVPSPNRAADLNGDGQADVCTANTFGASVSVALGNGDGTFQSRTDYAVGVSPRGLVTLDVDGDGDLDIVSANYSSNSMSLLVNNGSGAFAPAITFESGLDGEYGLDAGDMDGDGIFDLVVGSQTEFIRVLRGNGDGTFAALPAFEAGGRVWMIALGDMNGDGHLDVSTANGSSGTGSILLNDGAGNFSRPALHSAVGHAVATDIADLDGDGDLDWVLSSFSGGVWRLFTNDGAGAMTFNQTFPAVDNPACAVLFDVDNDRDLDLALIDEIADLVTIMKNDCPVLAGDLNLDGEVNESDRAMLCGALGTSVGEPGYIEGADLNGDNIIDEFDQQMFNMVLPPCGGDVVSSATFAPPADGVTDGADLAFLLGAWANEPSCADFVSSKTFAPPPDGAVNAADLAYLLGAWGACP